MSVRDGVWKVDLELGRDPVTGHRRRVARIVHGTREDAEVALARLGVADHEKRLPTGGTSARSVGAALQLYQASIESGLIEVAPSTASTVRSAVRMLSDLHLADGRRFGDVRLSRLNWQDIESAYAAIRARGNSVAWVRRSATILSRALEMARKRGLIESNPSKDAARPRTVRTKPYAPPAEDVRAVLSAATTVDPEVADAATIAASTGMRKGELLALRWCDVHLDKMEVNVAASVTDAGPGIGVIRKSTKTSDWRDVPLTEGAAEAFRRQRERRAALSGDPADTDFVFAAALDGSSPLRPDTLSDRWAQARGKSGVTLQQLRHYAATRMLDAGESYRTVADILGNSESTLRLHYDGRTDVGKRRAIASLEL